MADPPFAASNAVSNAASDAVSTSRRIWTLILAPLGVFLTALDIVVVATALPVMRTKLGAGLSDMEWTIDAYNLALACLLLTGAALGDRFGRRRMFTLGLVVFSLSSAACALSGSAAELIAARVVQGAGAAVIMPLTLVLIIDVFPDGKRGAAIGMWGGFTGLGVAAGPVVGGAITQGISWQWIFWVNVPIGLLVALASALKLRESHGARSRLDIVGLVLVAAAVFALTWAPIRAPEIGWGTPEVAGALVAGVLLMAAFIGWERRVPDAMLPMRYFRRRGFAAPNAIAFVQQISIIGSLFVITQLFQIGMGYSPLAAGIRILVWNGTLLVVAPLAGTLADRYGNRPFLVFGMLLQSAGLGWLAYDATLHVAYPTLIAPLVTAGVGISMVMPTVANAVTASVPDADAGAAAGVNTALRELGAVFGVALVALVFASHGGYADPASFFRGFRPAMWTMAGVALAGVAPALLAPSREIGNQDTAPAAADPGEPRRQNGNEHPHHPVPSQAGSGR